MEIAPIMAWSSSDPAYLLKEELLENLREGRWRPGEKLPTERQLSESFGVGRSTVRRVLRQLKELGLITQIVGSGTYIGEELAEKLPKPEPLDLGISPAELMDARLIFEPGLIDLVVRNGTATDLAGMEECCLKAEQAETLEKFEYWDNAFHQKIAEATHNQFVISVFELMAKVRERGEWGLLKQKSVTPERRDAYQREHRALWAALKNRDAEAARASIHSHLIHVRRNLLGY